MDTLYLSPSVIAVATPDGTAFQGDDFVQIATGAIYGPLVRALQSGRRTRADLVLDASTEAQTHAALDALINAGLLLRIPAPLDPIAADLWHSIGVSLPRAAAAAAAGVHVLGSTALTAPLSQALCAWRVVDGPIPTARTVVVAASPFDAEPLHPSAETDKLWTLVVPDRAGAWTASFRPGASCWACLTQRLRHNLPALALGHSEPASTGLSPAAAVHTAALLTAALASPTSASMWTHVAADGALTSAPVAPLDGCPRCKPRARPTRAMLTSRHTGVVTPARLQPDTLGGVHTATVRYRFPVPARSLQHLREHHHAVAGGKGWTARQARRSAHYEALEHLSGTDHPSRPLRRACARDLPGALLPADLDLFSEAQRSCPTAPDAPLHALTVPGPLHLDRVIDWVQARPLGSSPPRWVPRASAFYHAPPDGPRYAFATSNGCAAGRSLHDATRRGLLELIERDAVALWFYGGAACPEVDPLALRSPRLDRFLDAIHARSRDLWFLDATTDTRVPVVVAVTRRRSGLPGWCLGFGTGATPAHAAHGAAAELAQLLPATDHPDHPSPLPWADDDVLDKLPHLLPCSDAPEPPRPIRPTLPRLVAHLDTLGLSAFVIDQTHPLVGHPVVRTLVPGLVHVWRRLGAPRLYDVPLAMNRRTCRLDEADIPALDLTV